MEKIWFVLITIFLVFGMYLSAKYAKRAEKEEQGQGEYRFYLFLTALFVLMTIIVVRTASQLGQEGFMLWLAGIITAVTLFVSLIFISGKTNRVAVFTIMLTLVVLALSVNSFLLI